MFIVQLFQLSRKYPKLVSKFLQNIITILRLIEIELDLDDNEMFNQRIS